MPIVKVFGSATNIDVPNNASLAEIKALVCQKEKSFQATDFGIFYLGKELKYDETKPVCFEHMPSAVIFAIRKPLMNICKTPQPSLIEVDALISNLQAALSDRKYRSILIRLISNSETLQNLMNCIPGLRQDHTAQAVLKDLYMLVHWIRSPKVTENFREHPSLFAACQQLVEHMHSEVLRNSGTNLAMDDDFNEAINDFIGNEESDSDTEAANRPITATQQQPQIIPQQQQPQAISAQYLAAALAVAAATGQNVTVGPGQQQQQQHANPGPSFETASQPQITMSDLHRAVLQATGSAGPSLTSNESFEAQIAELNSMGFTDREEIVRALRHSSGDVQGALEFIINQRETMD